MVVGKVKTFLRAMNQIGCCMNTFPFQTISTKPFERVAASEERNRAIPGLFSTSRVAPHFGQSQGLRQHGRLELHGYGEIHFPLDFKEVFIFSYSGERILSGSDDHRLIITDAFSKKVIWDYNTAHKGSKIT